MKSSVLFTGIPEKYTVLMNEESTPSHRHRNRLERPPTRRVGQGILVVVLVATLLTATSAVAVASDGTSPNVTVDRPDGGELFRGGESTDINWTANHSSHNITSINISYSTDNGGNWTNVANLSKNDGTYNWTVPTVNSTDVLVRVNATDEYNNTGSDTSNATFEIDSAVPTVKNASVSNTPINGSETGMQQNVTVNLTEPVDTSVNATVEVKNLTSSPVTVTGSFADNDTWTGTVTFSDDDEDATAILSVANVTDDAGNTLAEDTSTTFTVDTREPVVTDTLDGRILSGTVDLTKNVTIQYNDGGTTTYEYNTSSGWQTISTPSNWNTTVVADGPVDLRVTDTDDVGNSNQSNATATVDNTAPSNLTIARPNSSHVVQSNATLIVSYSYGDITPNASRITLVNGTDSITYEIDDSTYAADNTTKNVTVDLSAPDTTSGNGLVDNQTYAVEVTAIDGAGQQSTASTSPLIRIDDTPPIARTGGNKSVTTDDTVTFDASSSVDNVEIRSYSWDFGGNTTGSGELVAHTYSSTGTYTVALTVTDTAGNTNTTTLTVTVSSPTTTSSTTSSSGGGSSGGVTSSDDDTQGNPEVTVSSASLSRSTIEPGDSATVSAVVHNGRQSSVRVTVTLSVDDERVASRTITVPAETNRTATFTRRFEAEGRYSVSVNGVDAGTLTVGTAATPTATVTTPTTTEPAETDKPGEEIESPTAETTPGSPTTTSQPGFGTDVAILALLGVILVALRRQ